MTDLAAIQAFLADCEAIAPGNDPVGKLVTTARDLLALAERQQAEIAAVTAERDRLRQGYEAIKRAAVGGRVCDDVAWFDELTTLYDFCDGMLNPSALTAAAKVQP